MTINIFVGSNDSELAKIALKSDQSAFLINVSNYKKFIATDYSSDVTVYTSFSDLPKITNDESPLFDVLNKADNIFYCPPPNWEEDSKNFSWESSKCITEWLIHCLHSEKHNVQGIENIAYPKNEYLKLQDKRHTDKNVLWISGCSYSKGIGVTIEEKYSSILESRLKMPMVDLSLKGSSLKFQSDQILRSDIRKNDIVVWGLTHESRTVRINNGIVVPEIDPEARLNEIRIYDAVTEVFQVINFCRKIQCKLIILPLLSSEILNLYLIKEPEFVTLPYTYMPYKIYDYGSDGVHPGPISHAIYARKALTLLQNLC